MRELETGFEWKEKLEFLKSKKGVDTTTIERYIFPLNQIMMHEGKYDKCIFKFDEKEISSFVSKITPGSMSLMFSVLNGYFNYYNKNQESNLENHVSKALKNFDISKSSYQDNVGKFVTSLNDLIKCTKEIGINRRDLLIALLVYMGFSSEDIVELRVANINFSSRKITYSHRVYSNVDYKILDIIKDNILDMDNKDELLIKAQRGRNKLNGQSVTARIHNINNEAIKKGLDRSLNYKTLRNAGCLSYYCTHEDEFQVENTMIQRIKLFKLFGSMKEPCAARLSTGTDDLTKKLEIFKKLPLDLTKMFDGDIEVSESEIEECKTSSSYKPDRVDTGGPEDFLSKLSKSIPEKVKGEKMSSDEPWYTSLKNIGDENEALVQESLNKYAIVSGVKHMEDSAGFDLRFKINNEIYRFEVKTLNKDLEFYISINEINSIFDEKKSNYAIAVVKNREIYVIEDVKNILGLDRNFIYNIYHSENIKMAAETFIVRLDRKLVNTLKTLDKYITDLELK